MVIVFKEIALYINVSRNYISVECQFSLICVLLNQQNTTSSCDMYITSVYKIEENYIFSVCCVTYIFSD